MKKFDSLRPSRLPHSIWHLINSPALTMRYCFYAAVLAFPFSLHLGLFFISASYIFAAYYIERRNMDAFIIPPLAIFAIWNLFSGSLAPLLLADDFFSSSVDSMLITHIVFAATFLMLIVIYWAVNRNNPPVVILENGAMPQWLKSRRFQFIALAILGFTVVSQYVLIIKGIVDRGYAGDIVLETRYGVWSYFIAFGKLEYVAYLLIPYIFITRGRLVRFTLVILLVVYTLFQVANSNRGSLVFPFIFIVFGYWMIGGSFKRVVISFVFIVGTMFILTPILGDFRGSGALQATDLTDISGRISLLLETQLGSGNVLSDSKAKVQIIGRALLGSNDPLIYSDTPETFPFAGWERFSGVLYLWMPSMFFPDKPNLLDGDDIRMMYTGIFHERSSITISYQADLYRRFGWLGILLGYPVYALAISLFVRYGIRKAANEKTKLWGLLILFFIITFIHGVPFGSVLAMIWNFLYDYPKYLLVLWLLLRVSKQFSEVQTLKHS